MKSLTWVIALTVTLTSSAQPQAPMVLSKHAQAAKDKIGTLSTQDNITMIPLHGEEEFGKYLARDEAKFTFLMSTVK